MRPNETTSSSALLSTTLNQVCKATAGDFYSLKCKSCIHFSAYKTLSFFFFDFDIIFKVRICIFLGCLTEN